MDAVNTASETMPKSVALAPEVAAVRDSKNPSAGALVLSSAAWMAFHSVVRAGTLTSA